MPWRSYFERWQDLTRQNIVPQLLELVPPAVIFDKRVYSPFHDGRLSPYLRLRGIDSLIISGTETDICVLATVLAAVDHGYRVIIAVDALCGSQTRRMMPCSSSTANASPSRSRWPIRKPSCAGGRG